MARLRIAVVEDDPRHARVLGEYVERFASQTGHEAALDLFDQAGDLLESYRPTYDILVLDIQMPGTDGMSAARSIRRCDKEVIIIFVTSAPQYAIKGYEVEALSYLLKPVPYESFAHELTRALHRMQARVNSSVVVTQTGHGLRRLAANEILYLASAGHHLQARTVSEHLILGGTMREWEERLVPLGFFRSNSSYIVNLRHVMAVKDQDAVMSNGERLRVSRPRKKAFMTALTEHLAEADS